MYNKIKYKKHDVSDHTVIIFDDQLTFKEHIAKTARSCRFALHNTRKIRPFMTEHAAQLLVQALVISRLDYCNALLSGLPSNTIKPLQMIQNAAARLVFNEPKRAHVTPLFVSLHWLPVAARIQFKTLMLAYRTTTGSAPAYFHSLLRIYIPSRSPAYFHSLMIIYIPSRSPAYFHSLLRIYIPSRSPAYFHSLMIIYISIQKPLLLPLTITNLHPLQKPRLLPLTITNLHPLQKPRLLPLTDDNLHLHPEAPPTSTHYYESTSPPEAPPTSTHYYESTSPPEAPPTSTHYYESTSPPEAPPTSTHYYESTSPPEVWDLLVSDASWYITERLKITLQNILVHRSWPVEWSSHPPSGILDPCQPSSNNRKLISFNSTWLLKKKKKTLTFSKSFSLSFSPSLASLYLFEQCLRLGVIGTSSVCLPLQD